MFAFSITEHYGLASTYMRSKVYAFTRVKDPKNDNDENEPNRCSNMQSDKKNAPEKSIWMAWIGDNLNNFQRQCHSIQHSSTLQNITQNSAAYAPHRTARDQKKGDVQQNEIEVQIALIALSKNGMWMWRERKSEEEEQKVFPYFAIKTFLIGFHLELPFFRSFSPFQTLR